MELTISDERTGVPTTEEAYAWCSRLARQHYENFPVGSLLIPRRLRRHVHAVYAFARMADDIADDSTVPTATRLERLERMESELSDAYAGSATHPAFVALAQTVRETALPIDPLRALLQAFRHDAEERGYETVEDLLSYCRCSANPVGRIVLHLHGLATEDRIARSDAVCTALQITNFLQDLSRDLPVGRNNIPRELLVNLGTTAPATFQNGAGAAIERLVELAADRFREGTALIAMVPDRRLRFELALTLLGGMEVLSRVRTLGPRVLDERPRLSSLDKLRLVVKGAAGALGSRRLIR